MRLQGDDSTLKDLEFSWNSQLKAHREIDLSGNAIAATDLFQALLTRKSNLLVGTNTSDKLEGFDIFFDKLSRKIYIDSMVYLGVMIPLDDYVLINQNGGS